MRELFGQVEFWHWLAFGGVVATLEMLLPGVWLLWFGMAAGLTGAVVFVFPAMAFPFQVLIFALFALVAIVTSVILLRRRPIHTDKPGLNDRGTAMTGRVFTLDAPIVDGVGRVKVGDSVWRIEGEDFMRGTKVRVVGINGATLMVEKA
ncbi:MAG: NfeD family protein [Pseudomonadota bacterium]